MGRETKSASLHSTYAERLTRASVKALSGFASIAEVFSMISVQVLKRTFLYLCGHARLFIALKLSYIFFFKYLIWHKKHKVFVWLLPVIKWDGLRKSDFSVVQCLWFQDWWASLGSIHLLWWILSFKGENGKLTSMWHTVMEHVPISMALCLHLEVCPGEAGGHLTLQQCVI